MNPAACPGCVAERRAGRVRYLLNATIASVIAHGALPCCFCCTSWHTPTTGTDPLAEALRNEQMASRIAGLALALVVVAVVLRAVVVRLGRRAATPLPAPAADPLATYREGSPAECPRHPFVR